MDAAKGALLTLTSSLEALPLLLLLLLLLMDPPMMIFDDEKNLRLDGMPKCEKVPGARPHHLVATL
jgi:hypothetical protein